MGCLAFDPRAFARYTFAQETPRLERRGRSISTTTSLRKLWHRGPVRLRCGHCVIGVDQHREESMGTYFSERELQQVESAENAFHSPIPTQVISNGEFNPPPVSISCSIHWPAILSPAVCRYWLPTVISWKSVRRVFGTQARLAGCSRMLLMSPITLAIP